MKIKTLSICIILMLILSNMIILYSIDTKADQPQWPSSWIQFDTEDVNENGENDDYKDCHFIYYNRDSNYLYLRMECYGYPDFNINPETRYKWFIDTDDNYNMAWQGGKIYEAEFLLFVEDSPKPGGDGIGEIYLIHDDDNDGFMNDDANENGSSYLENPISDPNIADYRIVNNCIDIYISQEEIGNKPYPYITWATDQEDPNLDSTSSNDRSDAYWNADLSKANLEIIKDDSADPVHLGEFFEYTLKVHNYGPDNAENVVITDALPQEVSFISSNYSYQNIGVNYIWSFPSIATGETIEITINVSVDITSGLISNTALVEASTYDQYPDNDQDTELTTVEKVIKVTNLSIEKTSEYEAPAHAGSIILYTINVTNHGPDVATNINVTDTLPENVTFCNATPDDYVVNGMEYKWVILSLIADESYIIKINVTVNEGFYGTIKNNATVENESDDEEIEVSPIADISIIKTSEYEAPVYADELVIYYLNITNHGPDIAYNVSVTDILPDGVTYTDSNLTPISNNGQTYQWFIESIDINKSLIIKINIQINSSFIGDITNIASVTEESYDPNEENNQDEVTITVSKKSTGGGGGGGPGGHYTPPTEPFINEKPTAIITGIYTGVPYEEIEFDGTQSHDNDEEGQSIVRYDWKFSDELDWQIDLDATPTHIYNLEGFYNVTLRVYDDENSSDTNTTTVIIIKPNTPPTTPEINGPENGTTNISYNFTVVSTDEDGDELKYTVDWGDGTTTESEFLPSSILFNTAHKWIKPGTYTITVTADDNEIISTDELTIVIEQPEKSEFPCWLFLIILFLILLLLLILLEKRRRDKKKQKETKQTAEKASTKK